MRTRAGPGLWTAVAAMLAGVVVAGCSLLGATQEVAEASAEVFTVTQDPLSTPDEIAAAFAKWEAKLAGMETARKEDKAAFEAALGTAKMQGASGGSAMVLGGMRLLWYLRDRRKKRGEDPLQRPDIWTPPTVEIGLPDQAARASPPP